MTPLDDLRNEMRNAFNQGKKYMLTIRSDGGVLTTYAEAPSFLGGLVLEKFGAEGIKSFARGDSNIYEIRNDHPHLKDGLFLQTVNVLFEKVN